MNNFFKNTRKLSMMLSALLLAITLTAGSFAYYTNGLSAGAVEPAEAESVAGEESPPDEIESGESDSELEQLSAEPMSVRPAALNMPSQLRGAFIVPGSDFVKQKGSGADAIYAEIDKAVETAVSLKLTAVVIDTVYNDKVIYKTSDANMLLPDSDIMEYLVGKCRDAGLFTSAIFDVSHYLDGGNMDKLSRNALEFAQKYRLDSVFIDGYTSEKPLVDYNSYIKQGGSIGFENYMLQASATIVRTVANAVHKVSPDMTVGLLADAVWANKSDNELGSATNAKYTALISGNADTKAFVERHFVDFVAVKAYSLPTDADEPFGEVVSWWNDVAEKAEVPMYVVHASDKIGASGWTADQLTQQTASISHYGAYRGSIFNSLAKLPAASAATPAPAAKQNEPAGDVIEPAASAQKPAVTPVNTSSGQTDANTSANTAPVSTGNGQTPSIDDNSNLIKEISPSGVIMASGGDEIEITATAYRGAAVVATINGESVFLALDESSNKGDAKYGLFTGLYTVPEEETIYEDEDYEFIGEDEFYDVDTDGGVRVLGGLSVYASHGDREETMDGAYMSTAATKVPIQITADQAKTYPAATKNNVPLPTLYPLPKGAIDYAVGKEFSYVSARNVKYTYVVLESGVRVETQDIKKISKGPTKNNKISGMTVTADNKGYTYVTLKTEQKVTYKFAYASNGVSITFNNTKTVPASKNLSKNPLFTKATWSGGNKLTLLFAKSNGFMGYKAYFDSDGNLVFRFRNPPSSIKNAKIAIDPGHGGKDIGAPGLHADYPEKVVTRFIADKVVAELESRGAEVYLMKTSGIEGPERAKMAEKWGADILLSIHCNAATKSSTTGTEVYYFYPFSRPLAVYSSAGVSKNFVTENRGAKLSYYHVTLSSQMASVLVECGFMTNKTEFNKLLKTSNHKKIATGLADSVEATIKAAKPDIKATGTESSGSKTTTVIEDNDDYDEEDEDDDEDDDDEDDDDTARRTGGGEITDLYFDDDELTLGVGGTTTLEPIYEPDDADNIEFTWRSSKSSVVSVDSNGKVKGLKEGNSTVTVKTKDGSNLSESIRIVVDSSADAGIETTATSATATTGVPLSKAGDVYIDSDWLRIYPGNSEVIEILSEYSEDIVRNSDFVWRSSKPSIATVNANGIVKAKAKGNTTITAKSGDISLSCDVEVSTDKIVAKGITLDKKFLTLVRKNTAQLKATLNPKDTTDKSITWSSSKKDIASVDKNGVVTGKRPGTCIITAKAKSGGVTATCEVEVVTKAIVIDYIDIGYDTLELRKGETDYLNPEFYPDNATDTAVTWKSSNPLVLSVDEQGNMKALKKGTATLTATAKSDKDVYASCRVTVFD